MKLGKVIALLFSHGLVGFAGFALGIYLLPILIAPPAPSETEVLQASSNSIYTTEFRKDLQDSDGLHWGEGTVSLNKSSITLMGSLAPGPDYKLYLSPQFVETEADFNRLKSGMLQVGEVKTFENFVVSLSDDVDLEKYNSVIVWCETFGEFITAGRYR